MRRKSYLFIPFLILSWSIIPILGLQSSSRNVSSYGTIIYPESQLGVFDIGRGAAVPEEASLVVALSPAYGDINLFENPGFEFGFQGWELGAPSDGILLRGDIRPGYVGNSAVMVSEELGYRKGMRQRFSNVPPNTTFHFKVMIKTVDVEALKARVLYCDIAVGGKWLESREGGAIQGSQNWALYEISFTTPSVFTSVTVFPALVYNRGEVWIDEASLAIEGWQPSTIPAILNWKSLHNSWDPFNPFVTEADLKYVEQGLKTVPIENFWGIIFIVEEHYRIHIEFEDNVDTTWFGEHLLGYPLYLTDNPTATRDQWLDEMFLRMIRGFHNYFSPLTKVGITTGWGSIVEYWNSQGESKGIPYYFGEPAMDFIREYYDFVILYTYTEELEYFTNWTKQYFEIVDQLFQKQKKFLVLTRIFTYNVETWQPEAIALEMKNCFDRNISVLSYHSTKPLFEEVWPLMLKTIELYNSEAHYYETPMDGENLLTGYVGETYGWVEGS